MRRQYRLQWLYTGPNVSILCMVPVHLMVMTLIQLLQTRRWWLAKPLSTVSSMSQVTWPDLYRRNLGPRGYVRILCAKYYAVLVPQTVKFRAHHRFTAWGKLECQSQVRNLSPNAANATYAACRYMFSRYRIYISISSHKMIVRSLHCSWSV